MKTIKMAAVERVYSLSYPKNKEAFRIMIHQAFCAGGAFAQQWISVEHELPEDRADILIKRGEAYVIVAGYYIEENKAFYCPYIICPLLHVSHWRYIELK
jgi:hypothetical protein